MKKKLFWWKPVQGKNNIHFIISLLWLIVFSSTRQILIHQDFLLDPSRNEIGYDFAKNQRQQRLFWSLPPNFLGNKVRTNFYECQ